MMLATVSGERERSYRRTIRILLVEDHPGDARLVEAYLREGLGRDHELVRADTLAEGLRQARGERPDLVLLDLGLPDAAGLEGLRRMRELRRAPPVVVLTGLDDEEVATYALGEGAQDYLVKDGLHAARLGRTVRYSLERSRVARELERTREAAEAHRALSRSILRSLPDHIAVVDADGVIVGTNEAWRRFARGQGGDPGSYEGESYLTATRRAAEDGDDDAARMLEGLREVLAGEREELALEYPCHGPETRRWFRASVTPLRDAPGRGAVISHIDITGRVEAETRLEEERSRLSEVFRQAPAWMATSRGPEHVFEMANPAYRRLVGDREIVGRPVREVLPELEGEGYFEMLDRVFRTGQAVEVEEMPLRLEREEGGVETKYVTFVYQPRREEGEVVGVLAHGVDVTEQVTAREAVEAAEELWSTVFETAPAGIVISDTSTGRIHAANETLAEIAGREVDEMVGRTSTGIGFWENPARREEIVAKVLEEGSATDEEAWLRSRKDGRRRAELSVRRLELAGEDRLLWAVQDVTEHVDRQRALEERTRELGERVKEQSCLYDVSRLLHEDGRSLDGRLRAVAERIPAGWQYPAITSARVELGDAVFGHGELAGAAAVLDAPIEVEGETVGRVQVGYREERPEEDLGPFLVEERRLLDEIADRIGSEVARHRTRREMERLVRTMTEAVVIVAPDGRITFANPAAERLLDLETSELADRTYDAPDWRITDLEGNEVPSEQLPFHRVKATGRPVRGAEHVVERGDGERIVLSINAAPLEDGSGRFEGMVASLRDVTEERRRERALRESEARFRTLFEKSLDPIVVTTAGGEFVAANDAYRELFGYDADDLAAMEVAEIYADPGDRERFLAAMESEGGVTDFEAELLTRRGEVRVCRVSSAPLDEAADGNRRFQTILHDVTDRRRLEEELRHRALHDELTGLPNRSLFTDRLEQATARAERRNEALGVLMVDLDRFKRINDSLGHTAGDRVLQEVARRLQEAVRAEDTVARWGGDEFAVILAELSERRDLEAVEERIQRTLGRPCTVGGEEIEIGASIGGVVQGEDDGSVRVEEPGELIRYADAALLRAKGGGTTSFHLFDADRDGRQIDILRREQDLRRGLEAGELEPFYQPIVDLETGRVWGVEPLARWRHPEKGLVGPADFIPLAEETGLIHRLGHEVCSRAFRDAARWSEETGAPVRVTPNISGRQFEDETVVDGLRDCLAASGLDPGLVHLEVTETAIMRATGRIEELRELGVRVHIDDFGTGYSSLVYLRDLEVDGLKIDMSFVRGLGEGRGNSAIVRTILTLSRELGLDVVAEGIETGDQLRRLREMGCGLGQGYLFARPMPAAECAKLLADGPASTRDGQDGHAA